MSNLWAPKPGQAFFRATEGYERLCFVFDFLTPGEPRGLYLERYIPSSKVQYDAAVLRQIPRRKFWTQAKLISKEQFKCLWQTWTPEQRIVTYDTSVCPQDVSYLDFLLGCSHEGS